MAFWWAAQPQGQSLFAKNSTLGQKLIADFCIRELLCVGAIFTAVRSVFSSFLPIFCDFHMCMLVCDAKFSVLRTHCTVLTQVALRQPGRSAYGRSGAIGAQ